MISKYYKNTQKGWKSELREEIPFPAVLWAPSNIFNMFNSNKNAAGKTFVKNPSFKEGTLTGG